MAWEVYLGCVKNEHLVLQEPDMRVGGRDLSHLGVNEGAEDGTDSLFPNVISMSKRTCVLLIHSLLLLV